MVWGKRLSSTAATQPGSKMAAALRGGAANDHLRRCVSHPYLRVRVAPRAWQLTIRRSRQSVTLIPRGPLEHDGSSNSNLMLARSAFAMVLRRKQKVSCGQW